MVRVMLRRLRVQGRFLKQAQAKLDLIVGGQGIADQLRQQDGPLPEAFDNRGFRRHGRPPLCSVRRVVLGDPGVNFVDVDQIRCRCSPTALVSLTNRDSRRISSGASSGDPRADRYAWPIGFSAAEIGGRRGARRRFDDIVRSRIRGVRRRRRPCRSGRLRAIRGLGKD